MASALMGLHKRFLAYCAGDLDSLHPERDLARGVHAFLRDFGSSISLPAKVRTALERMAGLIYAAGDDRYPVDLEWEGDAEQLWCCALLVAAL